MNTSCVKARTPGGNRANAEESTDRIIAPDGAGGNDKPVAALMARLVLAGFAVHRLDGGGFLVCRWGQVRHCPDARTLDGFAHQVGALR